MNIEWLPVVGGLCNVSVFQLLCQQTIDCVKIAYTILYILCIYLANTENGLSDKIGASPFKSNYLFAKIFFLLSLTRLLASNKTCLNAIRLLNKSIHWKTELDHFLTFLRSKRNFLSNEAYHLSVATSLLFSRTVRIEVYTNAI